jgi:tetratricopeptide (TPR) repeat protein
MTVKDGIELEDDGSFAAAARLYRRLLHETPSPAERAELLIRLSSTLRQDGEPDEAEEYLAEALKLSEAAGDRHLRAQVALEEGQLAEERGKLRSASAQYAIAADLMSGTSEEHQVSVRLASVERQRGVLDQALTRLRGLMTQPLPPELEAEVLDELGAVLVARGEYDQAVETLTRAVDLDLVANRVFAAGRSQLLLAEAHLCRGDRRLAKSWIRQAQDTYEDAGDNRRGLSDTNLLYGRLHEDANEFDAAAKSYRMALRLDQESDDQLGQARSLRMLAGVRRKQGDVDQAAEHLEEARNLLQGKDNDDVEWASLIIESGLLALRQFDYAGAMRFFQQALKLAEDDAEDRAIAMAKRHLSAAKRENGELGEAADLLQQAMPVFEARGDRRGLAELLDDIGELLIEQGNYRQAINYLEQGYELDQGVGATASRAWSLLLLGRAHLQLGERNKAGNYLKKAQNEYDECEDEAGLAAASYELGTWLAYEGQDRDAIRSFRRALAVQSRQSDRAGIIRTCRELSAAYRRLGDIERSAEYLEEAGRELGQATDLTERALLNMETARLALARSDYEGAGQLLRLARRDLKISGLDVEAATCLKLQAQVEVGRRNYADALDLLEQAKSVFEQHEDRPELDDLYDDLGVITMEMGDLVAARRHIQHSLELGQQMGWFHGKGRSFVTLGDIAMRDSDMDDARVNYGEALRAYDEAGDEVGKSECLQRLGDWFALNQQYAEAVRHYKEARRIDQLHRDLHGLAQVSRKLGEVYLAQDQDGRAAEALEQAEDYLQGADSSERAHIQFALGRLAAVRNDFDEATSNFKKALAGFQRFSIQGRVEETRRHLIECYKMLGQADKALEHMRALGIAHASMWQSLLEDLDPRIKEATRKAFYAGSYEDAVMAGYKALELQIRELASDGDGEIISTVARRYLTPNNRGITPFRNERALARFSDFTVASFDLFRNPIVHASSKLSALKAFSALCVASFIVELLTTGDSAAEV